MIYCTVLVINTYLYNIKEGSGFEYFRAGIGCQLTFSAIETVDEFVEKNVSTDMFLHNSAQLCHWRDRLIAHSFLECS